MGAQRRVAHRKPVFRRETLRRLARERSALSPACPLSGLWRQESVENHDQFLHACGFNFLSRKLATLNAAKEEFFIKQSPDGDEIALSQMRQGQVVTSLLRIGDRTECSMPDESVTTVTSDELGKYETRRWLDGESLIVAETLIRDGESPVTCKRELKWVGTEPVWGGYSEYMAPVLAGRVNINEEDLIGADSNGFCAPGEPDDNHPLKGAVKGSLHVASQSVHAIKHSMNESWATLETLFVDKPPKGELDWHSVFGIDPSEALQGAFNCSLNSDIIHQGRLYVFDRSIAFYSALFGRRMMVIKADDVTDVRKLPGLLPPSAILIKTLNEEDIVFGSFLARDKAYDLLTKILWDFSDDAKHRPPPVAVGFGGERYIFVQISSARGPVGGPVGSQTHDAFCRVRIGQYESRTPTAENSPAAPRFNTVCCFPATMFNPATDKVQVTVFNEGFDGEDLLVGHKTLPLAGIRAVPTVGSTAAWKAASAWHKLTMQAGGPPAEVCVSMWTAGSAHPAFAKSAVAAMRPQQRAETGLSAKCAVYEEPRMAYLFLEVRRAAGLQARPGKVTGLADPYVHVTVGQQQARSSIAADTLKPEWQDAFTFCVEKPLGGRIVLQLYDGEESEGAFMGQVVVPLQSIPIRRGNTKAKPASKWYRLGSKRDPLDEVASRVVAGDFSAVPSLFRGDGQPPTEPEEDFATSGAGGRRAENLGELELCAYLDSDYIPHQQDRWPVGQLAVEIVRARQIQSAGELFAVAQYGRHWVRLPTISRQPEWRQELVFPVRDMGEVLSIGVFRSTQAWALSAASEEALGKARIRPGSLLPGRAYRESLPLFLAHGGTLAETGSLDVVVKFVRFSAAATLGRYLALPMPPKCYLDPPAESTAAALGLWEAALVEDHLAALDPPLSAVVQRYMRPASEPRLSMRLLRVHVGRLLGRFFTERAAGPSLLDPEVWWRSPGRMALIHIVFILLCLFPELAPPALVLGAAGVGFSGRREVPAFGTDPWLSTGGQFAEAMAAIKARGETGRILGGEEPFGADGQGPTLAEQLGTSLETQLENTQLQAAPQEGEEQRSLLAPEEQAALVTLLGRYATVVQHAADRYALRLEQILGIFMWRDPLVSRGFFTALTLLGLALFVIPLRSVIMVVGIWVMRHPVLRSPTDGAWMSALTNRLASNADNIE